ncbi:MAG TPA: glycosyltransferase, partial [Thermoanaerobaculia bacterium]|nr:glycosyltransferase [Thermoanaerobaculia bacterium]
MPRPQQSGEPRAFSPPADHRQALARSRCELLAAVGTEPAGFTYVRGIGNRGDELIQAGTRLLLAGLDYREIGFEEVAAASGELAVISGGGAWCRWFHEIMPRVLALAEMRFARVVVLPSSFDPSEEAVRDVLGRSRAVVFARERESWRQIRGLCDARLAHDCAFFFDYTPFAASGDGVLHAYRTDREASSAFPVPADNEDISALLPTLRSWLQRIASAALVRTDRAHVMIAAALLGKEVEYRTSAYHKVPAIAEFALAGFAVRPAPPAPPPLSPTAPSFPCPPARHGGGAAQDRSEMEPKVVPEPAMEPEPLHALRRELVARGEAGLAQLPPRLLDGGGEPRVTVVVLSWNQAARTRAALASLREHVRLPVRLLAIDNNSAPAERQAVRRSCQAYGAELVVLERNLGCGGGRQVGVERAATEYVMFLDNDAEVFPGTVEHLVHALDGDPAAVACGGNLILPEGRVQLCGGDYRDDGVVLSPVPMGRGLRHDDPGLGSSGPCRWLGGALLLARRAAFASCPLAEEMAYFEDNEWSVRVQARWPGSLRRAVEALGLHHQQEKERRGSGLVGIGDALPFLAAMARFYQLHGRILDSLFGFVPELTSPSGQRDVVAARLLLDLIAARGVDWTLLQWLNGGLAPLFQAGPRDELQRALEASRAEAQ